MPGHFSSGAVEYLLIGESVNYDGSRYDKNVSAHSEIITAIIWEF